MIYLFTGKIHSGKTTMLLKFIDGKVNIAGVLAPVIKNKRYMKFVPDGTEIMLESDGVKEDILTCGKYKFRKSVFESANIFLKQVAAENYELILIDEAGILELENSGLHDSLDYIIKNHLNSSGDIIIVVRDSLVNLIIEKYGITDCKIIKNTSEL